MQIGIKQDQATKPEADADALSAKGATPSQPGAAPPVADRPMNPELKARSNGFRALLILLLLLAPLTRALAQAQNTGTIAGNVTDPSGAVVPNAVATLTSIDTAQISTVKTNGKGEYLFSDVKVGDYILKITAPTFETFEVDLLSLDADQNVRQDAKLKTGAATETVTVQADSTIIDTRSATIGTVIDKNLVENMPIDGENIVSLAALLPGVSNVNAPTTFTSDTGGPTYSVSGSRGNENLFLLDGSIWNNAFYNTGLNYPPRLALQEVSVLLNNFKAQYGRNSGSVFNALTRSGSNKIHGNLWEYFQSNDFDAHDYIDGQLPHLVENQFGATVGGPIQRDKAFFFLSYQDLRLAGQVVASDPTQTYQQFGLISPGVANPCSSTGPFAGMNCANFSQDFHFVGSAGCPTGGLQASGITCVTPSTAIKNPVETTTSVFPNSMLYGASCTGVECELNNAWIQAGNTLAPNQDSPCAGLLKSIGSAAKTSSALEYLATPELPTLCFNPVSANFINKYIPFATTQTSAQQLVAITAANQPRNDQEGLVRVDLNLGRHTLDSRFYVTNVNDFTANSINTATDQGIANYEQDFNSAGIYFGSIGDTWVLKPNTLNAARIGYKRYTYNIMPSDPTTFNQLGSALVLPQLHPSLPQVEATDRFTVGSNNSAYSYTLTSNYELDDNLSITKGNHNVQVGVQFLGIDYIHRFDATAFIDSEQQQTEDEIGDFLLGLTYQETFGNFTNLAARQHDLYLYAQDDWRATARLTLNLGMRYELPFSWKEIDGQGLRFNPGYQSIVFPTAPSSVCYQGDPGCSVTPPTRVDNWGPRFGIVYDVFGNGSTSIRAGFGIFYNAVNANTVGIGQPYHYTAQYQAPLIPGGFSNPLLGYPAVPAAYVKGNPQFTTPFTVAYADPHNVTPYVMATNIGIQQRVSKAATLEINYVGKFSRHDMILFDQNPAIVDCSGGYYLSNPSLYCLVGASSSAGTSSYAQRVKYPGFNYGGQGIVDYGTIGSSNYNGLQVIYTQRALRNINVFTSYTWARSLDDGSEGTTTSAHVPDPAAGIRSQYGPSDFNAEQIFNLGWVAKLPTTAHGSKLRQNLLNDWSVTGIYNARTGNPINVTLAGDISFTDDRPQRPSLKPGVSPNLPSNRHRSCSTSVIPNCKVQEWFNTAAFVNPTYGTFGNVTRNSLVGPAYINLNTAIIKRFQLPGEGKVLELKLDGFNVFNTPNLANPGSSLASSSSANQNFGIITATVGTNGVVGSNGRRIQIGGIIQF
jgi:hypothetical protein